MRRPDTSGDALPLPGRRTETASGGRITKTTAIMALALLSQCGHNDTQPSLETRSAVRAAAPDMQTVDPAILETKREEFTALIRSCAGHCTASEAMALASVCGDKPLTPEKLSAAAAKLSPNLRASVHSIAEILGEYPQLAPDVLPCLHQFLSELPMTDARKLAGVLIPCKDESLDDEWNIATTSRAFLKYEESAGVYKPKPPETLTADANVRSVLTHISNSVDK